MTLDEVLSKAKDTITVRRVYGEPYEKDGLTVIPAAMVAGGGGGGSGHDQSGGEGEGGGFGMGGRPAGAFVIKGSDVKWMPAVDPNRIMTMAGIVTVAWLLMRPLLARARAKGKALVVEAEAGE
ncbi:sporulation protein [Intrasporangium oryzae NRRL B-24470]|uniref:Sporulation protein n=1 Tax=Intrasporangium oryzae NRRL B-24470 TaxID=1386089 RepID=W9GHA3_9MICO|nr:sporulation protein [Intrasporangium oryzae]EWT03269.1 sporulation protein [Intrasporangium oryzae NRRL B-24470]